MKSSTDTSSLATGQGELIPLTLTGIRPGKPQGQHIELIGEVGESIYYCKNDSRGLNVCATDWFYSKLASHVGIPIPDISQILNPKNGELLFGSKEAPGTAEAFEVQVFLTTQPNFDPAVGDPYSWVGSHLSRVYAFDLFAGNPDRQLCNFLLVRHGHQKRLLAFDFASSQLIPGTPAHFAIAHTQTLRVGRHLRKLREFDVHSATEILEWIKAVPISQIETMLSSLPDEWITEVQRGQIYAQWSGDAVTERVDALIRGLRDGSLL